MIDFRYHLVSIVAVFLALAIGIVIGASALKPDVLKVFDNASSREQRQITSQQAKINSLQNQLASNQAFAQAAAPRLLSGLLAGQQVALVTAPGADATTVNGITAALKLAGAKITTQAQLQPSFFDTSASTQSSLETLAQQTAPPGLLLQTTPPGANPQIAGQQQAAQVLAAALVTKSGDLPADQVNTILSGFTQQGFLQLSPASGSTAPAQATLAVVITPASPETTDADPANLALISVAKQLSLSSHGVVLAGTLTGSGPGSAIDELINGSTGAQLSSVDNADKEIGQILVAQALSYLLTGHKPTAYGTGAVPSPAPTPSPTPSAASSAGFKQPVGG